jgi:protein-S-isoprenylcysteine O-methyltransferase Ste14
MIPLIIGISAVIATVFIQSMTVVLVIRYLFSAVSTARIKQGLINNSIILSSIMLILFSGHLIQIAVWAEIFVVCGEFDEFYSAFYHSMVNFSSLGYGDIVMSDKWRLLGSLEAVNGILMFGISTAVFYTCIRRIFRKRIIEMINSHSENKLTSENVKNFFSDTHKL